MKKKRNGRSGKLPGLRKMVLMMKLCVFFLFASFLSVAANGYSQNTRLSLMKQNASVIEVLTEISQKTDMQFLYNDNELQGIQVNVSLKNATLYEMLDKIFAGLPLSYSILDSVIVISPKGKPLPQALKTVTITGQIKDKDGNPLPGATVRIKDTQMGVVSDQDGKFKLEVGEIKDLMLQVSFIGYKTQTVKPGEQRVLYIVLEEEAQKMDEVVVTGYFTKTKSSYTGSAVTVQAEELKRISPTNLFKALQAYEPSLQIVENNEYGSDPNKLPEILIRGKSSFEGKSNNPLFIMDGYEVDMQKVFDFDIERIKQITILKDASATAIYGSRAANGVIVIETKMPEKGRLTASYNFNATVEIPDLTDYDLLNAAEKLEFERLAGVYKDKDGNIGQQRKLDRLYESRHKEVLRGVNTYWLSQPVKNAFSHAHSLFVEGGADNVRYGIDASYNQNKGVMKESGRDRFGLGFSLIYRIKDKITIKNYISYAHTHAYNSPYGSFSQYAKLNPYERIYNDNGELIPKLSDGDTNPLYDALLPNRNFTKDQEFREQLSVDWFICDGLRLKGQMAIVKGETSGEIYKSPFSAEFLKTTYNSESRVQEYLPIAERGYLSMTDGASFSYDGNVTLNYNTLVNEKHIIYAGAGLEVTQNDNNSHGFIMTGFPDDRYSDPAFAIQYKKETKPSSSESKSRAIGFFANGNYSYDDRYFADVSVRIDGSSKFGADKKYAPFWSAGAGWNVHNEKFFKHTKISMLKLRYSYGVTGNQEFSAYQAKTMFQFNTDRLYNSGISAALMGYGNPDLEWQNQYQSNYGFDFGYAKDRIRLQFNYYQKKTEGMLTSVSVAPSLGLPSNTFTSNLGKIQNKGVEVNLNAVLIRDQGKDFEWSVMLQAAHNKNKIMEISTALKNINEKNNQDKTTPAAVYEEGESMSAIKAVPSLGIDPTTGQELFMKKDGTITYTWDATDKVICGDSEPKVFGNVGTNLYWKGWNLNMVFKYDLGADYYNSTLAERVEGANPRYNADRRVLNNRWKEPGQHALYKNIKEYTTTYISSRFVQKENTLQLTSLSLSYDLNREWIRKFGLNTMRLSFYMNDVFRASTVKNERGLDYPFQRSFVFGLNIGF